MLPNLLKILKLSPWEDEGPGAAGGR